MYYVSTDKISVAEYNAQVTIREGYHGATAKWADVLEHQNGLEFAILKHKNHECDLTLIDELPIDWYKTEEP